METGTQGVETGAALDPYHYARDHAAGPGRWCVMGPGGFKMTIPGLDKNQAYLIGKLLSRRYVDALRLLAGVVRSIR